MSQGNRAFAVVFILALTILTAWTSWFELQNWQATRERGLAFVQARVHVLAETALRAVQVADTAVQAIKAFKEQHPADDEEGRKRLIGEMVALDKALPETRGLAWVDRQGHIRFSSADGDQATPLLVADRDYFTHFLKNRGDDGLFIGELTQGRRTGRWFLGLARPLRKPGGQFDGVVLAPLDPNWFRDALQLMSAQDNISVALFSRGGRIINAVILSDGEDVQTGGVVSSVPALANSPWRTVFAVNGEPSMAFVADDADGNALGVAAIQKLPGLPLAVMASRPWDEVISAFRRDLIRDAGLLAMVLLILGGIWGPMSRVMRDRDRLFALSPDPVCITDSNGHFLRINPAWQNALGYNAEDLASTSHLDLIHPLNRHDAQRLHGRLMAGEAVQDVPLRYQGRNGDSVWLSWSAVGERGRAFIIARDITRRRDTERALAKSEARFRDVAEALSEFIWEIDAQGVLTYISGRARSILGEVPVDLLGFPITGLLDRNSAERMIQVMRREAPFVMEVGAYRGRQPQQRRHLDRPGGENGNGNGASPRQRQSDDGDEGRLIWLRLSGVPVLSPDDGGVVGFRGAGVDITESKISRQALADSEARYRSIVNTVVEGIITIDERGTMQSINPAAEAIFGYPARDLVGRNVSILVPEPFVKTGDSFLADDLETDGGKTAGHGGREVTGTRRDGSAFPLELGVSEGLLWGSTVFHWHMPGCLRAQAHGPP